MLEYKNQVRWSFYVHEFLYSVFFVLYSVLKVPKCEILMSWILMIFLS
jgi:hypothetical protein